MIAVSEMRHHTTASKTHAAFKSVGGVRFMKVLALPLACVTALPTVSSLLRSVQAHMTLLIGQKRKASGRSSGPPPQQTLPPAWPQPRSPCSGSCCAAQSPKESLTEHKFL